MGEHWHVTREEDSDLGFALSCLASWAVDLDEFRTWVHRVIADSDEIHEHLLNLGDIDNRFEATQRWRELIGWWPSWGSTEREECALDGISYARIPDHTSDAVDREPALAALRASPHVLERFQRFFPGIPVPGFIEDRSENQSDTTRIQAEHRNMTITSSLRRLEHLCCASEEAEQVSGLIDLVNLAEATVEEDAAT